MTRWHIGAEPRCSVSIVLSSMSMPIRTDERPPAGSWLACRALGVTAGGLLVILSLAFVVSYKLIPNDPGNLHLINVCRTIGKVAIAGGLFSSGIAIGGLFFDRRKALALLVVIGGLVVAGVIGTFVYNI